MPLEIEGETVASRSLVDEGRSSKSVADLLAWQGRRRGPSPSSARGAKAALVEILVAAGGQSVNADEAKKRVAAEVGVSTKTVWRAFDELRKDELAGAAPGRDKHGSITEWRWYAKAKLLVGRGDE